VKGAVKDPLPQWGLSRGALPFFALFAMLAMTNLYLVLVGVEFEGKSLAIRAYFLLTAVTLLSLPLLVLSAARYALLMAPLGLLAPFEFLHIHFYRSASTLGAIGSSLETNPVELMEFLTGKEAYMVGSVVFVGLVLFLAARARVVRLPVRTLRYCVVAMAGTVLGVGVVQKSLLDRLGVRKGFVEVSMNVQRSFQSSYPFGFIARLTVAANGVWQSARHRGLVEGSRFNAHRSSATATPELYVTILGETARFSNWSLNGYQRETSPRLERIAGLTSFEHMCSPSNVSRVSVPLILTKVGTERYREVYREKSFIAAFAEAGFRTYWISNQGKYGQHDNSISMHAGDAAEAFFIGLEKGGEDYDSRVLPVLSRILGRREQYVEILIHTMGSHYNYSARYPRTAAIYLPDRAPEWGDKKALLNSYDNSIAYADAVIAAIIEEVDKRDVPAVVTFISDHGENLGDNSRGLYGHPTALNTISEYHVPFFVWLSDEYRRAYPDKSLAIAANRSKWAIGSDYFHTITDLASIECEGCRVESSLARLGYRKPEMTVVDANGKFLDCKSLK